MRPARLGRRAAFRRLAASSVRARSGPVGVRWAPPGDLPVVAVGFAVTTRQGSAVVRNRMRRRVRGIVAEAGSVWPPGDYLITLEAPVATMAHGKLRDHVERAVTLLHR
ncbi:MAG TPA: ribonuclease P protein component [Acidimicrobiales bacterium]|nr:ribonuclease P protein component [Acidimicrobiales bacterium]